MTVLPFPQGKAQESGWNVFYHLLPPRFLPCDVLLALEAATAGHGSPPDDFEVVPFMRNPTVHAVRCVWQ